MGFIIIINIAIYCDFWGGGWDLNSTKWDKFKVWGDAQSSAPA